jgi:hypothetical protein
VKSKIGWMFVESSGVSFIGGNCQKSSMNIMLIPPNGKMLNFIFCSFRCIVASKVQPTIDISSIMMNWIYGHMPIIEVGLFTLACLLIKNPNKTWIVVSFINKVTFAMYVTTFCFCLFPKIRK